MRRGEEPLETPGDRARRLHGYRRLVMRGQVMVPLRAAAQLIGPDCAYHLYRQVASPRPKPPDQS